MMVTLIKYDSAEVDWTVYSTKDEDKGYFYVLLCESSALSKTYWKMGHLVPVKHKICV